MPENHFSPHALSDDSNTSYFCPTVAVKLSTQKPRKVYKPMLDWIVCNNVLDPFGNSFCEVCQQHTVTNVFAFRYCYALFGEQMKTNLLDDESKSIFHCVLQ